MCCIGFRGSNRPLKPTKESSRERARQLAAKPPPLPRWQSSVSKSILGGQILIRPQQGSPFMRLPKELRDLTYDAVFGCPDSVIHITTMTRRLGGIPCWCQHHCIGWGHDCWGPSFQDGAARTLSATMGQILSLPLACKRLYSETIFCLYARNTFNFRQLEAVPYFHQNLTTQNWQAIRAIEIDIPLSRRFDWSFDPHGVRQYMLEDPEYVEVVCRSLRTIPALQKLSIRLTSEKSWFTDLGSTVLGFVLEHLSGLQAAIFTVMITERLDEKLLQRFASAPFTILSFEAAARARLCSGCSSCPPSYDTNTKHLPYSHTSTDRLRFLSHS